MAYTYDEMLDQLTDRICRVLFTKKNGEQRDMLCTRNMSAIPKAHTPKGIEVSENTEVIKVYDVKAEGWRAFRVENVILFE